MEQEIRKAAIKRFIQGEKPKQIYESLKRSKPWFFSLNETLDRCFFTNFLFHFDTSEVSFYSEVIKDRE